MSIFSKISSFPLFRLIVAFLACLFILAQAYHLVDLEGNVQLIAVNIFGIENTIPWLVCFLFDLGCVSLAMFTVAKINSNHRFVDGSTFPLYVYLFVGLTTWPTFMFYPEVLFASMLGLFVLSLLLQIYKQGNILGYLFASSVLGSIATLFYPPSIILVPLIFVGFSIFRPFDLRSVLFVLIGYGIVFLYLFGLAYVFDWNFKWPFFGQLQELKTINPLFDWKRIGAICFIIISLLAMWKMYGLRQKLIVRQRNQLSLVFTFLICYVILALIFGVSKSLLMLLIPLSLSFLSFFHSLKRKWIIELVLLLILGYNTWLSFFN